MVQELCLKNKETLEQSIANTQIWPVFPSTTQRSSAQMAPSPGWEPFPNSDPSEAHKGSNEALQAISAIL